MLRRLETAQHEGRLDRIERAVEQVGEQARAAEARSAGAVEAMGRELLNIARNLNGRMEQVERTGGEGLKTLQAEIGARLERDGRRLAETVERRLTLADDRHALALEKLGGEISRISEQLSERISASERRSAQALDEIGERLTRATDKIEQRYDRASGELAERMRLSEERTARLLAEARESLEARGSDRDEDAPVAPVLLSPESLGPPPIPAAGGDWRAAAFPETFEGEESWAAETQPFPAAADEPAPVMGPVGGFGRPEEAPPPVFVAPPAAREPGPAPAAAAEPDGEPDAPAAAPVFGGFGGADVRDVLEATGAVVEADSDGAEPFAAETEFVDPRHVRRASSAREALDAARAAMTTADARPARAGFGLKRGGKSRLQERLDKQARGDGSTVGKTLLASVTAVAVTGSIVWGYNHLGGRFGAPEAAPAGGEAAPLALTLTPAPAVPAEIERLYDEAAAALEGGDEAAVADITEAAEAGSPRAQFHLARLYETGEAGLEPDLAQARMWTERAAGAGEARAMHNLAMYMFDGDGGPRDQAGALTWFTRAARAGLTDSQYNLARLYETGAEGVAADAEQAYLWYLIAARNGDTEAAAAADRIGLGLSEAARRSARVAAERFQAEPVDAVAEG
jgi:localization factor PodJL